MSNDKALIDKLGLKKQESGSAEVSGPLASKMDFGTVNVPLVNSDKKVSDATTDGVPSQPTNERLIKYTFQRKRKKESLSSTEGGAPPEESTLKRKMGEKQNDSPEPQKSNLIAESSRDSRRLAQVARQLISLSEKKWW
ncbi:hypothetical protein L1049_027673 [Liquidambar formosana]|uniref:Uncharacterized protein n=1 Tax=Liquidambar formosana TaxID=63359 RepID=A0AAP0RII5_LIQFO